MANRPVFRASNVAPWYRTDVVEFPYHSGLSVSQKQKNIEEIHKKFQRLYPNCPVLEISSKSMQEGGVELSAFNLTKEVPGRGKVNLECVYHAGKVFYKGGPYTDLMDMTSRQAKKDPRLKESGHIIAFEFDGERYPTNPETIFYNYLYFCSLRENPEKAKVLEQYGAFTDIEFNPKKSLNCQAQAAAVYVSLWKNGLLDEIHDFKDYYRIVTGKEYKGR